MTDHEIEEILIRIEKAYKEIVENNEERDETICTTSNTDDVEYECRPDDNNKHHTRARRI